MVISVCTMLRVMGELKPILADFSVTGRTPVCRHRRRRANAETNDKFPFSTVGSSKWLVDLVCVCLDCGGAKARENPQEEHANFM